MTTPVLLTTMELDAEHQRINDINTDMDSLLEKRSKIDTFQNISLKALLANTSNATIDVFKELVEVMFKKRRFRYQEKFNWWSRYNAIGTDIHEIFKVENRYIYFGFFLILLAFLLNFLDMLG